MTARLHRCRTPTNWLCPCGRVARELAKHDVEFETERVAWRARDRDEIDDLTGQRKVPVLELGGRFPDGADLDAAWAPGLRAFAT